MNDGNGPIILVIGDGDLKRAGTAPINSPRFEAGLVFKY
jgi:hypothetical protein